MQRSSAPRPLRPLTFVLLAPLAVLPLGACGGQETSNEATSTTPSTAAAATTPGPAGSAGPGAAGGANRGGGVPGPAAVKRGAQEFFAQGQRTLAQGRTEEAVALFRRVLQLDPEHVEAKFALGTALVPLSAAAEFGSSTRDLGVLDEALKHLEAAVAAEPDSAEYAYWVGRALDLRGREDDALAALERAIELEPDHGPAHKRVGLILLERGEVERARASFESAAEHMPDDAGVRFQLGNLWLEDDPEKARDQYEAAIAIDPTFPRAYYGLSQALAQLGQLEEAEAARAKVEVYQAHENQLKALNQRAADDRQNAEAQFAVAEYQYALGHEADAYRMLRRTLEADPQHALAHYYCGLIMVGWDETEAAVNHFEEFIYFDPTQVGAKVELMRVYHGMGETERVDDLASQLATDIAADDLAARNAYAEGLIAVGKADDARAILQAVLEAEPENEIALILLERTNP